MLTPLEKEMLTALKDAHKLALKLIVMNGTDEEFARIRLEPAEFAIARAEAKERQSAEDAHQRMIALRNAEDRVPPDSLWQPEAGPDDGEFLGLR